MGGQTDRWTPDMYLSEKLRQDENHRTLFFGTLGTKLATIVSVGVLKKCIFLKQLEIQENYCI
jgi:hypothetical protein